ncbi:MAG: TonB family protein [Steroidobacteraceae bacterium]
MLASDDTRDPEDSLSFSFASDIVELVICTDDDVFMQTLREAVGDARRLWHVPSADKVSDLLVAGQVGILVLDAQSCSEHAGTFVAQIKRQFPDLVVVVAGNRDAEGMLAKFISDGSVYRFIHKPMSPARAKLFAEAAVKKYVEQRQHLRTPPPSPRTTTAKQRHWLIGAALGAGVAGVVAALIAAWTMRHGPTAAVVARPPAPAAKAPLVADTGTPPAGPADIRERLLTQAENALLGERLEEAAVAIEAARKAGVESGRVTFLNSQLAKLREQRNGPARLENDSRAADTAAGDGRLQQLLRLAAQRIKGDRLVDPDQDSARFYVLQALQIDPHGNAAQAARETLARDLLAQTRAAIERRDFARAGRLLDAAGGIAAESNVDNARLLLLAAQKQADADLPDSLLDADRLTLVQSVTPVYPSGAAQSKTEGWVELDFTVAETGAVEDIAVHAANPPGVFDTAAIGALSQWRYQPVLRADKPAAQRARIRIRFALAG